MYPLKGKTVISTWDNLSSELNTYEVDFWREHKDVTCRIFVN